MADCGGIMNTIINDAMGIDAQCRALLECNAATREHGITLSAHDAAMLASARREALRSTGRVEFASGTAERLVTEFAASPYITQDSFAAALAALTELFYLFKNETGDLISDEALIKYMRRAFDGECRGSIDVLASDALPELARRINRRRAREGLSAMEAADE